MTNFSNNVSEGEENKQPLDQRSFPSNESYIVSCDIGTTKLRCIIFDSKASIHGSAEEKIDISCPQIGLEEIDPNILWMKFIETVKCAIQDANLHVNQVRCMGLSTQRATFIMWDRTTGKPLHHFVTWKDLRASQLVEEWNKSITMRLVRFGSSLCYFFTRKKRFLAASIIEYQNIQVNMRLKYVLENDPNVKACLAKKNVLFGTLDTWLIYKLTGGKVHASDHSNASGTAIYDPFLQEWSSFLFKLINLPKDIFPKLRDTSGYWGQTDPEIFGTGIPITCVVSDQGAALFGGCSFYRGDVKITLGTGAFLNVNTGREPHASIHGIYPVVGWKDKEGIVYMAEGSSNDNGTIIEWGKSMGFFKTYAEVGEMASSVEDSNGVFFIPGFHGLQAPINDAQATGGFIGLTVDTKPEHFVRAIVESLAFRVYQIFLVMKEEVGYRITNIRIDGGVSQNDIMMQMISTLTNKQLQRPKNIETSSIGCCFLAGLGAGIWNERSEIENLREVGKTFEPQPENRPQLLRSLKRWEEALDRFTKWYPKEGNNNKSIF